MASHVIDNHAQSISTIAVPKSRKDLVLQRRPSIQELKHKYEQEPAKSPKTPKPKSPRKFYKSTVKQMASMFNNRIAQIIGRTAVVNKYTELVNEFSPESKPVSQAILPKPVPLPRTRFEKEQAPIPSPRRSKTKKHENTACYVAEEIFAELTVKDKALLYSQFIGEMTKKNSTFDQLDGDATKKVEVSYGDAGFEKLETIKDMLKQLEAPGNSPRGIVSPTAEQSNNSCRKLENLFFSWLKERHGSEIKHHEASNTSEMDEEKQRSAIERLLEEAMAKLEITENSREDEMSVEVNQNISKEENLQQSKILEQGNENIAPAADNTQHQEKSLGTEVSSETSATSSTVPSAKTSETEESESGLSSLTKTTSEESQPENYGHHQTPSSEQPPKTLRKKKMRRSLTWRKDSSLVETCPIPSTDSDTECEKSKVNSKPSTMEQKSQKHLQKEPELDESFVELNQSLMRDMNSPRKIKSAYTLTAFSPVPPSNEEYQLSKRYQAALNKPNVTDTHLETETSFMAKSSPNDSPLKTLAESFDQGFETGSNDIDSPIRPRQRPIVKRQNATKSTLNLKPIISSTRLSLDGKIKIEIPSGFSTPIKSQNPKNFNGNRSIGQQTLSPISIPFKNRRRSIYDSEPRRSSLAMQVIREDQPLEAQDIQSPKMHNNTETFFATAPSVAVSTYTTALEAPQKTSKFWIKTGDFSCALDIFYNDFERVKLLYEIFSQTSCETKEVHFGIDNHKFSPHITERQGVTFKRLSQNKENSHYWFSTGDLAIPFSGKLLSSQKVQRLFQFIRASVEETGVLRFGVDAIEFSNIPEFWSQSPKFSLDSNYSMLVGLQSGNSNGLEGRSKNAWPHSKPVAVTNLDDSEFETDDFGQMTSSRRLSFSPFGSNYYDLASLGNEDLMMPRNSEAMKIPESFYLDFENEPLDQLFDDNELSQQSDKRLIFEIPEMINSLKQQQQCLTSVQERLSLYNKSPKHSEDALEALKGTPEYITQLKTIVSDISKRGCSKGFKECSVQELERYMFFLSRYADVCLSSCGTHLDTVLEALKDQRAVVV